MDPSSIEQAQVVKKFNLVYTEDEIQDRIKVLQASENIVLLMKVSQGQRELEELQQLIKLLNEK